MEDAYTNEATELSFIRYFWYLRERFIAILDSRLFFAISPRFCCGAARKRQNNENNLFVVGKSNNETLGPFNELTSLGAGRMRDFRCCITDYRRGTYAHRERDAQSRWCVGVPVTLQCACISQVRERRVAARRREARRGGGVFHNPTIFRSSRAARAETFLRDFTRHSNLRTMLRHPVFVGNSRLGLHKLIENLTSCSRTHPGFTLRLYIVHKKNPTFISISTFIIKTCRHFQLAILFSKVAFLRSTHYILCTRILVDEFFIWYTI